MEKSPPPLFCFRDGVFGTIAVDGGASDCDRDGDCAVDPDSDDDVRCRTTLCLNLPITLSSDEVLIRGTSAGRFTGPPSPTRLPVPCQSRDVRLGCDAEVIAVDCVSRE